MCCSAAPAHFSGTSILVYKVNHPKHGVIHVLGYENTAVNQFPGPNAMLLHLPARGEMSQKNFIDTSSYPRLFADLRSSVTPYAGDRGGPRRDIATYSAKVEIFNHGIYTVVLAQNALDIPKALKQVPVEKRPTISKELCRFYATQYKGWPIALCCFNNSEARKATPLLLWYEPLVAYQLMAPTVDSHTGGAPDLFAKVHTDHFIIWATDEMESGHPVRYSRSAMPALSNELGDDLMSFLPKRAVGMAHNYAVQNGDFGIMAHDLEGRGERWAGGLERYHGLTPILSVRV